MSNPKVAIITRTMNRLEYLTRCIAEIYRLADYDNYDHIIINQNSSDGTKEFLHSLLVEGVYKLKVKNNEINTGDAGGMKDGYDMLPSDCKYVMQFDSDCYPLEPSFLKRIVKVMEADETIGLLMLRREGVFSVIAPLKRSLIKKAGEWLAEIDKGTCCTIIRKSLLDKINLWYTKDKIGWGFKISEEIRKLGFRIVKAWKIKVMHSDNTIGQLERYPIYFSHKTTGGSNFIELDYSKIQPKDK